MFLVSSILTDFSEKYKPVKGYAKIQESVLSHTYAFKIINSTSFLPAPSTLAKQESLLVRVRIVCTKCFCLIGNSS